MCLVEVDLCGAAIPHFEAALRTWPTFPQANNNLGSCLVDGGRSAAAIPHLEAAVRARPDYVNAHFNLGRALAKTPGREFDAIAEYQAALRLNPALVKADRNLGELLMSLGRTREALVHFEAAQRIHPDPEILKIIDHLQAGGK